LGFTTGTQISGCLIPFLLAGTTETLCSLKMVKQRAMLLWKMETWLPNSGVSHKGDSSLALTHITTQSSRNVKLVVVVIHD